MQYRLFGRHTGLRVSEIALGTGLFGSKVIEFSEAKAVFDAYVESGGRFIDTAEGYQNGRSEEFVGRLVGQQRDDFVIASKFGVGRTRDEEYGRKGNSRKAMMTSVEGSLRRLKTDYLDLYWLHAHDNMTPMEEILRGLDDLVRIGKIRYAGLSNFPAWRIARGVAVAEANGYMPITGISLEYGVAERTAERELLPMADALGIGVGFWSPLGGGFLARPDHPDGTPPDSHLDHWTERGRPNKNDVALLNIVRSVASEVGASSSRVALAWLLAKSRFATTAHVPIIGASNPRQVIDDLAAADLTLPTELLAELDSASAIELGEPHDHNNFHATLVDGGSHHTESTAPA